MAPHFSAFSDNAPDRYYRAASSLWLPLGVTRKTTITLGRSISDDYHPSFQQIALVDTDTGDFQEQRLAHREQAEKFYRDLAMRGEQIRLGMEASGQAGWFERLQAELQFELWISDAAEIQAKRVRKKKRPMVKMRGIFCACWWRIALVTVITIGQPAPLGGVRTSHHDR